MDKKSVKIEMPINLSPVVSRAIKALDNMGDFVGKDKQVQYFMTNPEGRSRFNITVGDQLATSEALCYDLLSLLENEKDSDKRASIIKEIHEKYLDPKAVGNVNLPSHIRGLLIDVISGREPSEDDKSKTFNNVESEGYQQFLKDPLVTAMDKLKETVGSNLIDVMSVFIKEPLNKEYIQSLPITSQDKKGFTEYLKQDTNDSKHLAVFINNLNMHCETMRASANKEDFAAIATYQKRVIDAAYGYMNTNIQSEPDKELLKKKCDQALNSLEKSIHSEPQSKQSSMSAFIQLLREGVLKLLEPIFMFQSGEDISIESVDKLTESFIDYKEAVYKIATEDAISKSEAKVFEPEAPLPPPSTPPIQLSAPQSTKSQEVVMTAIANLTETKEEAKTTAGPKYGQARATYKELATKTMADIKSDLGKMHSEEAKVEESKQAADKEPDLDSPHSFSR